MKLIIQVNLPPLQSWFPLQNLTVKHTQNNANLFKFKTLKKNPVCYMQLIVTR